ncbi:MAG: Ada Zn binding protein [Patescibacteria group bacterium]|nr:Ada Zn binding protein [Patescibacteria group bacterium]MDQ5962135.1 Ada Zn binding protein [Patescibacteria group bacterium]
MSIPNYIEKIKSFTESEKGKDVLVLVVMVCVAISSFTLGRLSITQKDAAKPMVVKFDPSVTDYFYKDGEGRETLSGATSESPTLSKSEQNSTPGEQEVAGESAVEENSEESIPDPKSDIVASSRGSKYYYTYCSGAKTLSEANKVYFSSEEEAEANGYTLSTSCSKK